MQKNKYFTPSEILERNKILQGFWTAADIGYLFKLQLVSGYKSSRYTFINEDDVLRIYYYIRPTQTAPLPR